MDQVLYIGAALAAGLISATQVGLIGAITRERGPFAATWISMLASLAGMAVVLGVMSAGGRSPHLHAPFQTTWIYVTLSIVMAISLLIAGQGLPQYVLVTGLTSIPYLLAASWAGPKIGVTIFFAAVVTGQLVGSVALDHTGAFGAAARPVDAYRLAGIAALIAGLILIRGRG